MLLPRNEGPAEEAADPRLELVRQLVEYKKFKDAAVLLETQAERQLSRLARQPIETPTPLDPAQQPLRAVELWDLVSAFGRLMRETLALQPQQIVVDETPIQVYQARILEMLEQEPRLPFENLFTPPRNRGRLVGLFLAMLELMKTRRIIAQQDEVFGDIWISPAPPHPPPAAPP
jgi:segregation and condensation protein A